NGDVTIDLSPVRTSPSGTPTVNIASTPAPPVESNDFTSPPAPAAALISEEPHEGGDYVGVVNFFLQPGALEPGSVIQATNVTQFDQPKMDEPNEDTAEADGSAEISVAAQPGDQVGFISY